MIRWSITDKKEIFQSAIIDILDLRSKNLSKNEIIQALSPKYQEREIDQLSQWIDDVPKLAQYEIERLILKVSLWILLAGKLLALISLPTFLSGDTLWDIAFMLLIPLINIVDLVLAYRVTANSYPVIFMTMIYSLSSFQRLVDSLFLPDSGIINWVITWITVSACISAGYIAFKLMRALPWGLMKTNDIMSRIRKEASTVPGSYQNRV